MVSGNTKRHRPSPSKNKITKNNQLSKQNKILFSLAKRSGQGQSRPKLLYPDKYYKNKQTNCGPTPIRKGRVGSLHFTLATLQQGNPHSLPQWCQRRLAGSWSPPSDNETSIPICQWGVTDSNKVSFPIPAIGRCQKRSSGVRPLTTAKQ